MLILNLKTAKYTAHTPLSAYYLNSDINHSQFLIDLKKIGNCEKI